MSNEIESLLKQLNIQDDEVSIHGVLNEIKQLLIQSAEISSNIINSNEFYQIEGRNSDNWLLACDILEICMSNLKVEEANNFYEIIEKILKHPNQKIGTVGIREVAKLLKSQSCPAVESINVVLLLIDCLQSKETSIGTPTIEILIELLPRANLLDYQEVKKQLENSLNNPDDVIRCRTYNVGIGIANKDAILMGKANFILSRCLIEMEKQNDVLLQLNILELLKDLCIGSHGLIYLENKGVLDKLMRKIETINEDPFGNILIPGIMKFFAGVAALYPEKIINSYPAVISSLFDCLLTDDFQLLYTGLDTLGYISKSAEGKKVLDTIPGDQFSVIVVKIMKSIPNYPSDLKPRALSCLENVFWIDSSTAVNNQITYILQKWFDKIFHNDTSSLLNLCHSPFDDIALAAFGFLRSLSYHKFGQDSVAATGGFVEFLLDRAVRSSLEVKQIKYDVILILSQSNSFDASTIVQLKKYVREGVHYVTAIAEVAFESAD